MNTCVFLWDRFGYRDRDRDTGTPGLTAATLR